MQKRMLQIRQNIKWWQGATKAIMIAVQGQQQTQISDAARQCPLQGVVVHMQVLQFM